MQYTKIILFGLFSNSYASFMIPINMDFKTQYFNESNCRNPFKINKITDYCINDDYVNETRKCCYDAFESINVFGDLKFNTCYPAEIDNKSFFVNYHCDTGELNLLTITQIMALIGVILLGLIFLIFLITLCKFIFFKKDNTYMPIN